MLVSLATVIALGATSMSDLAVLAHLAPVLGTAPSGPDSHTDIAPETGHLHNQ